MHPYLMMILLAEISRKITFTLSACSHIKEPIDSFYSSRRSIHTNLQIFQQLLFSDKMHPRSLHPNDQNHPRQTTWVPTKAGMRIPCTFMQNIEQSYRCTVKQYNGRGLPRCSQATTSCFIYLYWNGQLVWTPALGL